jgi:uncharacterized membrane protein
LLLAASGQSLVAYLLSFLVTAIFWVSNRELFARVAQTDNVLTALSLGLLCGIAIIPAAVHVFYAPGGLAVGFKFYCLVMVACGLMNSAMWIYASARRGVMRSEISRGARWAKALPTLLMPAIFLLALFVDKDRMFWVVVPIAVAVGVVRRIVMPRLRATKTVDSAV